MTLPKPISARRLKLDSSVGTIDTNITVTYPFYAHSRMQTVQATPVPLSALPSLAAASWREMYRQREIALARVHARLNEYPADANAICIPPARSIQATVTPSYRRLAPDVLAESLARSVIRRVEMNVKQRSLHQPFHAIDFERLSSWFLSSYGSSLRPIFESRASAGHPSLDSLVSILDECAMDENPVS